MTAPTSPLLQDTLPQRSASPQDDRTGHTSRITIALAALTALVLGGGAVLTFEKVAPSLPEAIIGAVGLICLVFLAVGRYEAAVALGFLLSGVVKIEPAPPDGVFAVIIAIAVVSGRLRIDRIPAPVAGLLAALVSLNVLSFAAALNIGTGIRFVAITLYVILFGIWLAGYADRDTRGRRIVIAWLWIAVISALLGSLALQLGSFPARDWFIGDGASRADALFKDPNVYGPFLVPISVILLEEMISPRLLRIRAFPGFLMLAILIVGLIFSFSRAAWANMLMATAIMLAIKLLRRRHTARIMRILGGLAIVGMIVLAVVVLTGKAGFIGERAQLQGYDSKRFSAQHFGVDIAEHYPFGVGPGNFQYHYPVETHSTYVRVLAEQGILAEVVWIGLCLVTLGFGLSNAIAGRNAAGIGSAALLGSWVGLLFNSAVVDTLHWRHLWVVAGLIWAATLTGRSGEPDVALGHEDDDLNQLGPGPERAR
ncbi:MAG: O-antigen ligase family protein, partial [Solirubrobacteraceae bacterium]